MCIYTHLETLKHVAQIRLGHMIKGVQVLDHKVFSGCEVNFINFDTGPPDTFEYRYLTIAKHASNFLKFYSIL